jgi:hypothetical protein
MCKAYILKGTENEHLLVIKTKDEKEIQKVIDALISSRVALVKNLGNELEKSLNQDVDRRDISEARSKNKSKSSNSNNGRRRKTKDT